MPSLKKSGLRRSLVATVSLAAFVASAGSALAQAQAEPYMIQELVITAEKREQALQDVPVAVSAFTSQQRDTQGITNIQDFVNFTPGMNYSGTDRVSLRGAGRNTFYIGNDPGVAAYSDGFYSASSSELFKTPLFIERTEILRGPQGTLYGRNAMGGAINQVSKRPSQDFSGEIRAAVGNYEYTRIEGVVSLPVADNLRFKVGGNQEWQRRGFIENIGSANEGASIKRTYFEAQVEAELGDSVDVWVRYNRSNWDDSLGVGDRLTNLVSPYDTTRAFQPIGGLVTNFQFGETVVNPGVADPYVQNTNRDGYGALRGNHVLTGQITWDLGFADLRYIGGFQQYDYQTGGDYDNTSRTAPITVAGVPGVYVDYTTDFYEKKKYYSNELNLTSNSDGPLNWILGLYQYNEDHGQRIQLGNPQQSQMSNPCYFGGATNPCIPAPANPSRNFADNIADLNSKAYAVFGQFTYAFSDAWALTTGLRYTKDEKDGFESQRLVLYSPAGPFGPVAGGLFAYDVSTDLQPGTPGVQNSRVLSNSWDAVTGVVNLDWTPDDDSLFYAKYSRGYKSGGFLLGTLAPNPEGDAEFVNAYELGMKKTIARQLIVNASLYYNDYTDLQLNLQQLNAAGTAAANNFINVDARAYGLELETIWEPSRNLQVSVSYGYLNTEITRGCCFYDPADPSALLPQAQPAGGTAVQNGVLLVFQDLEGSRLFQSPEHKVAMNANYTWDFGPGSLIASGTAFWTDETIYQPFDNPAFAVPAYTVADFRLIWRDIEDRYSLIGFVKNAFEEEGFTSTGSTNPTAVFGNPNPGLVVGGQTYLRQTGSAITRGLIQPRTFGLELQYRF
ncbi:TonB-dependent receptor [Phenylobacterium sp.]|uniref:TonB-dependent receptor n=1 Tax=Phenylobacterium sp. TaxID=1871053 RepID=UPI002731E53E|nr:TonB-dependent receptor [Phenylobacterium sp.]MDP1617269.1 TonB-dependent receptor [Phenylobacterium sp.]